MTTIMANTAHSMALDPEEEAFRALKATICSICRRKDIASKDDARLRQIVDRYKDRYPSLTPESIEEELRAVDSSPIDSLEIDDKQSLDASALTRSTAPPSGSGRSPPWNCEEEEGRERALTPAYHLPSLGESMKAGEPTLDKGDDSPSGEGTGCWSAFAKMCNENSGYNPLTYSFLLTFFVILMFLTSVIFTYFNYNVTPERDWALAGGVTSTSAEFRVRGPASDDGKRREFVVSTSSNLAIEKYQILNTPVSYGDFDPEEHFVRRISMNDLQPLTVYYYGIARPQSIPNSAVVAGVVGSFTTPAPEGTRMDFTIATGSCALTGSKSDMFTSALEVDPLLFINMGDLHYEDLNTLDIDKRLEAYDKVMGSPSQRLLYMRTIFSYMWDDHDWLGNNQDSDDEEAAAVAKRAYTLGIPHYALGSTSSNTADAAKYQAFTIGTVRFIITDLRSESVRSSDYYAGKVYSKEQKQWLFNEFSRAENYDFVVWVTTRPWTDPEKLGSDSWGGFVPDRNELSAHIASTIGAGPRNLLVLSGDNHMVAFDDGSSTDYSGQDWFPGGFPLLHSGPLTNYGGLSEFFKPNTNYFTDGCRAYSNELNHQFSTVDFTFPSEDDRRDQPCIRIKSYSEDTSNVIFEKEMCSGELMKYGTPEQDTCTLKKMSVSTGYLYIAAAALIVLNGLSVLLFLGLNGVQLAFSYFGLGTLFFFLTIAAAVAGAFCFRTWGINMLSVSALVLIQSIVGSLFVGKAIYAHCVSHDTDKESKQSTAEDVEEGAKTVEKFHEMDAKAMEENESFTHDGTLDVSPTHQAMDAKESAGDLAESEKSSPKESSGDSARSNKSDSKESAENSVISEKRNSKESTVDLAKSEQSTSEKSTGDSANSEQSTPKESTGNSARSEKNNSIKSSYVSATTKMGKIDLSRSTGNSAVTEKGKTAIVAAEEMAWSGRIENVDGSPAPETGEEIIEDLSIFEDNAASVFSSAKSVSLPSMRKSLADMFAAAKPFDRSPDRRRFVREDAHCPSVSIRHGPSLREVGVGSTGSEHPFLQDVEPMVEHRASKEEEDGIEVTNPTNRGTKVRAKVAPKLVEL